MATQISVTAPWRRWVRRTNVYIAEYILMLLFMGAFIGILTALWFSFFNLLLLDGGYGDRIALVGAVTQMASLLIIAPLAFWLYARVTGQEMIQPEVRNSKARLVFLTIWLIGAVCVTVGVATATVGAPLLAVLGVGSDAADAFVGMFMPGLFAILTLVAGITLVVKHVSRSYVMKAGYVLAGLATLLFFLNLIVVVVKKDSSADSNCSSSSSYRYDRSCESRSNYYR